MKKSLIRKSLLVSMAVVLGLSTMVTGCKKAETNNPKPTEGAGSSTLKDFKDLEVSWYIHYDWAGDSGWGSDLTTKYIQDTYGVKVKWVTSGGAAKQKLATMIASNELPDVITLDRGADTDQLVKAGILVALDDYVKKYPNLMKWATPKVINALRSPEDNKFYGVPNWYTNEQNPLGNQGIVLNQKYYKEMGSPKIDNLDDLYKYMNDLKAKYSDVTPMSFGPGFNGGTVFYTLFGEGRDRDAAGRFFYKAGNELKSVFEDPAYQEYLLFANKLYREGLISSEDFTMKGEQWNQKAHTGKIGIYSAQDALGTTRELDKNYRANDPQGGYAQIEPPAKAGLDKSKITVSSYGAVGWNHSVITKSAKDPEKIFAFLDWLTGEDGSMVTNYGPKGLYWDETMEYKGEKINLLNDKWKNRVEKDGVGGFNWVANGAWASIASAYDWEKNPVAEGVWDNGKEARLSRKYAFNTDQYLNIAPNPTTEEGIIYQSVRDELSKYVAKVVLAKTEEDAKKEIDAANANAKKLGYDKVLKIMTENWQKNLKK
jgi:putative aldouronate transport system substrate-binding protein